MTTQETGSLGASIAISEARDELGGLTGIQHAEKYYDSELPVSGTILAMFIGVLEIPLVKSPSIWEGRNVAAV